MPDIHVEFQQLRDKAQEIRVINGDLKQLLIDIQNKIKGLEADYTSDASDTIRAKIDKESRRINDYDQVIESYCVFMERTAERYEQTGAVIRQNAESQFAN